MTDNEIILKLAEFEGHRWYWRVNGSNNAGFIWFLFLAYPPEEGIGTCWKGCAGETREATSDEIKSALSTKAFTNLSPNYLHDLNAVHKVISKLEVGHDGSQADDFQQELWNIVNPGVPFDPEALHDVGWLHNLINATARQRCLALVRVIDNV